MNNWLAVNQVPLPEPQLQVENVSFIGQHKQLIIQNISFDLHLNEKIAIIGPNGSGKTTLVKALCGLLPLSSGTIRLNNKSLATLSRTEIVRNIAFMAQKEQVDMRLTVADYVSLGRLPFIGISSQSEHQSIVAQSLLETGMATFAKRSLYRLSGGEYQRVILARAFAQSPKLLILDEPTNHLDPQTKIEILQLINKRKITAIAILHDLSLVQQFAERTLVMHQGKLIADASTEQALCSKIITPVFGLESFTAINPKTGRSVRVFDSINH